MDMELMKKKFAEAKRIKHFDAWVYELMYRRDDKSLQEWYEDFARFCYAYREK